MREKAARRERTKYIGRKKASADYIEVEEKRQLGGFGMRDKTARREKLST